MTICLLYMLPKNRGNKNPSFKNYRILTMVNHTEPQKFQIYKDDSKCLISQNEKENQKTNIVNM